MALRILLADDSMTAQNMGKKILTEAGFDVITVSNGAAAVKKLAEATPDIAILDVYMPGYTGLELCERLKSAPITASVPVLLSVGKMEPFRPEDGMKVRADGVIIKPFEATDLVTVIDKLAERAYGPDARNGGAVAEEEIAEAYPPEEAPVRETTAEGLETFSPVPDGGQVVAPEPHVEFTSAPKAGAVVAEQVADLQPTIHQLEEIEEPAEEVAAPEFESAVPEITEAQAVAPDMAVGEEPPIPELPQPMEAEPEAAAETTPEQPIYGAPLATEIAQENSEEDVDIDADAETADIGYFTVSEEAAPADMAMEEAAGGETSEESTSAAYAAAQPGAIPEASQPAGAWKAIEGEATDDIDLDLEAEMQETAAVPEAPYAEPAPEQPEQEEQAAAPTVQESSPFLAPFGKTSYDELDAVMEQTATQAETATPVVAEEIPVSEEIAEPAAVEETPVVAEEIPVAEEEIPVAAEEVPVVAEEIPVTEEFAAPVEETPAGDEFVEAESPVAAEYTETIAAEQALVAGEAAPRSAEEPVVVEEEVPVIVEELPVQAEELSEPVDAVTSPVIEETTPVAAENIPQVVAEETTSVVEEVLAPPVPVESVVEKVPEPVQPVPFIAATVPEPTVEEATPVLAEEIPVVAEEIPLAAPIADPAEQEPAFTPENEIAVPPVADDVIEPAAQTPEVAAPAKIADVGAASAALAYYGIAEDESGDILRNPVEEETDEPLFSMMEDVPRISHSSVSVPEEGQVLAEDVTAVPVEEDILETEAPTSFAAQVKKAAMEEATSGEETGDGAVGRVVERVVDRLKPILSVMVEEILAEVKKK